MSIRRFKKHVQQIIGVEGTTGDSKRPVPFVLQGLSDPQFKMIIKGAYDQGYRDGLMRREEFERAARDMDDD